MRTGKYRKDDEDILVRELSVDEMKRCHIYDSFTHAVDFILETLA